MKRRLFSRTAVFFALVSFGLATAGYTSYWRDCAALRAYAAQVAIGTADPQERVLALLDWVHSETGTAKNASFFLLPHLGATPWQVLESGGDCADKSRLLSSMLRQLDIPATMAMCINPQTSKPSHTVVEARIGPNEYMVVDPAFDLAFPRPGRTGYYGLLELRKDPAILHRRLEELAAALPRTHPLHSYNRTAAVYDRAMTINWGKNSLTGLVHDVLMTRLGDGIYRLPRPLLLEEPKLFVGTSALMCGALLVLAAVCGRKREEDTRRRPRERPRSALLQKARLALEPEPEQPEA